MEPSETETLNCSLSGSVISGSAITISLPGFAVMIFSGFTKTGGPMFERESAIYFNLDDVDTIVFCDVTVI